ncbi:MAG: hypothetical protein ACKOVA_09095 [Novosphingobium sp.]
MTIVRYNDDATTRKAIGTGEQPSVALAQSAIPAVKKANPAADIEAKFAIKTFPLAIGVRKNEPELKTFLDSWVKTNLQNGKLNSIFKEYHGASLPAEIPH